VIGRGQGLFPEIKKNRSPDGTAPAFTAPAAHADQ
jgi:hypothetical protein